MQTPHDFYLSVINRSFDIDGWYGPQCWDGAMYYSKWLGYPIYHCSQTGYVKDIWNLRKSSGILKYYDEVQRPFQDGDIIVWDNCTACPLSHIAIFRLDNGNGTFVALGQNQDAQTMGFTQKNFTYSGVMGGLRPKCYTVSNPKPSTGKSGYWNYDAILKPGDEVTSSELSLAYFPGSKDYYRGGCVYCPDLGGAVPTSDISEANSTKDGKLDGVLKNVNARIYLDPCKVEAVDQSKNLVKVHGYWIKPDKLARKEYR